MRPSPYRKFVYGFVLASSAVLGCSNLTEVDWNRIPPAEVGGTGGSAGSAGTTSNAGANTEQGGRNAGGTSQEPSSDKGSAVGSAGEPGVGDVAGAGGA